MTQLRELIEPKTFHWSLENLGLVARQMDKKMKKMIMVCLHVVAILASTAKATNGMKTIGIGPVQRSMGGANVGLPLDSAVTITNPAGMTKLSKRFDISVTYFDCDVNYKAHSIAGMITSDNIRISSDTDSCIIPGLGVIWPVNDKVTLGVGAYGVCGMGVDYRKNLYNNITYTDYQFMKIAPGLAYKLSDKLSLGAALNLDYAMMDFEAGSVAEVAHNDGEAYGLGFTVGALYEATDELSFGFAYESKQYFSDFRFNTVSGTDKLDFDQPQSITLGLGIKPSSKFRLAFDVSWIDWPQTNGENKPVYTKNSSGAAAWNLNWDQQLVYKVGVEYDLNEKVALRAGYNYGKSPLDSSRAFENISFPAIAEHHITAGMGIKLTEKLTLNLGFMYAPKVSLRTANSAQFIDTATTEMSQYAVDVGLAYKF